MDLNEFQTRKQKIDILLKEQGWNVKNRSQVIVEVDSKQSDFTSQNYKTVSETFRNSLESKYIDYLLLDSHGNPLAIIEAKRTSKDPIIAAQKQAEEYANDIKSQLGKDIFIFLTNGYDIWFWDRNHYGPRVVKGFFSQNALERLRFQSESKRKLTGFETNSNIVDWSKSVENVKRVIEHIQKGNRKALVVMATGTGKTRVAMAIIDIMLRAGWAERVLFLTDRKALRKQAFDAFKEFIPHESRQVILTGEYDKSKRLYASTIQTFMEIYNQKDKQGRFLISPGDFDIIISDEAHRSIYNKWKDVFTYLDAIQIGLTATPSEFIERDTFRFFNCNDGMATALYDYDEAVRDGILCDFRRNISGAQTHFQIKGIKPEDLTDSDKNRLIEQGIDPFDIDFEGTELEKKVALKGTSEAIVREFMDNCLMDQSGTLPAKSIFFAITKKHAKRLWEAFERLYPEYKGKLARIIVSGSDYHAQDMIDEFKTKSFPRVAISVDMLDTGVNVPEVCNLVMAKPVFSKIKFWQMLGRGTRSNKTCTHKQWLPDGKKEYFKVFDFWNNFEYWDMHPDGDEQQTSKAITSKIFMLRLKQLRHFKESKDDDNFEFVKKKVQHDIESLPKDSVSIREHMREVEKALSLEIWEQIGIDPIQFLKKNITPLMRYQKDVNLKTASFILKCEQLGIAILKNDSNEIEHLQEKIGEMLQCLPQELNNVKPKLPLINNVLSKRFWDTVTYEDAQMLIDELSSLMKYMSKEPRKTIVLDMDDVIEQRKIIEFGPEGTQEHVKTYKEKVEKRIKDLADSHPTIKKIKNDEMLDESDLENLEKALDSPELYITEDILQKVFNKSHGSLIQFIKNILGLYEFPDPKERIQDAFKTYIIENNKEYNADQLNFIRTLQTVFVQKKHIVFAELFDAPFTNFGINAPLPMFTENELKDFIRICINIENEFKSDID